MITEFILEWIVTLNQIFQQDTHDFMRRRELRNVYK